MNCWIACVPAMERRTHRLTCTMLTDIPVIGFLQKKAIRRRGIDAREYRERPLENFVMQSNANRGKRLRVIDGRRLLCGGVEMIMDGSNAQRDPKDITQKFFYSTIGAAADQS